MVFFISSSYKSLKTEPAREICTYTAWVKSSSAVNNNNTNKNTYKSEVFITTSI